MANLNGTELARWEVAHNGEVVMLFSLRDDGDLMVKFYPSDETEEWELRHGWVPHRYLVNDVDHHYLRRIYPRYTVTRL